MGDWITNVVMSVEQGKVSGAIKHLIVTPVNQDMKA